MTAERLRWWRPPSCAYATGGTSTLNAINVASLEVEPQGTFGRFVGALPEFEKINNAAYWDYQHDKIFVRSNPLLKKAIKRRSRTKRRVLPTNTTIEPSRPATAPLAIQQPYLEMEGITG